ncbi:lecithin retinol acyltransferase family protein [Clostridium sp. LBM24168]
MKKNNFIKILILIILIISGYSSYKIYSAKNNFSVVDSYSQIKVPIHREIIWDNISIKSISVKNSNNQPIKVYAFLDSDKKNILINPPVNGFTHDNLYYITISHNIHLKNGSMDKDKIIKFKVKDEKSPLPNKIKRSPKYGDIIGISDEYMGYKYDHYGVYVGNNRVIHYCSSNGRVSDTEIQETNIYPYFNKDKYFVLDLGEGAKFSSYETVKRAKSRLGEKNYNLLQNNCEHFAVWAKTGSSRSYQLDKLSSSEIAKIRLFMSMGINLQ